MSVIALAACGDNDDAVPIPIEPTPSPRLLTVEVSENPMQDDEASARVMNRTAAATTTASLKGFTMNYTDAWYNIFNKESSGWSTVTWPDDVGNDTPIDFYAHDGGAFQWNDGNPYLNFTMNNDAFSQKDLLVATHKQISYNDAKGKVSLTFDHACAAVQFQICKTNTVKEHSFKINSIVLKNVRKNGDYYYDSGWTLGSDRTNYTLTNTLEKTLTSTLEKTSILTTDYQPLPCKWLFLIPQSQDGIQLEIKYTVDEGAEKTKILNVGTDSWEQGKQYTVNIRVGSSFLS